MVSNKNLTSSSVNDKHLLNYKSSSKTTTNGHSNGHHLETNNKIKLESQFNSTSATLPTKAKLTKKKDVNKCKNKTKSNHSSSSIYDFLDNIKFDDIKFDDEEEVNSIDEKQSSINLNSNSLDNSLSFNNLSSNHKSSSSSTNSSTKKQCTKKKKKKNSKLFTIQNCIKNEIRKKLLQKSMKLSKKKNGTKVNGLTNGNSLNGKKSSATKLNGKTDKLTSSKLTTKLKKKDQLNSPAEAKCTNKKLLKKKKEDANGKCIKSKKQPRISHLTKTSKSLKANGKTNGRRKQQVKKELLKKSELLIRNLRQFRQYLRMKRQELTNLDLVSIENDDELLALNQMTKDLMHCFVDTNSFEIDFDIYDPLTISGLMNHHGPFSNASTSKSILSNNEIKDLINNLAKTDDLINEDVSTEDELTDDDWTSAPSSPI